MDKTKDSNYFESIEIKLANFSLESFNSVEKVNEYVEVFSIKNLCQPLESDSIPTNNNDLERSVSSFENKPFKAEYNDLCRLHFIALSRKCLNILEFGSGFSTVVLADAMKILHNNFAKFAKDNIRVDNPFHIYAVEEEQRFLEITQKRLGGKLESFATITRSSIDIINHDSRIATIYSKLPNISPDFIYLDGPSQFGSTKEINGFSFNSKFRMPMSADILLFEFFLEPGTLILVDGRTANARFLKSYLRRTWAYLHDPLGDIHYFELQEEPLGPYNNKKIEFCIKNKWLLP